MKDVALHAVIIGVVLVLYGVVYAVITSNYQGLIYYFTFLSGCLLWYRRVEGKINPKNVAKYSAQGSILFIILGLVGVSLKGLTEYTYIWFVCWMGLLAVSLIYLKLERVEK